MNLVGATDICKIIELLFPSSHHSKEIWSHFPIHNIANRSCCCWTLNLTPGNTRTTVIAMQHMNFQWHRQSCIYYYSLLKGGRVCPSSTRTQSWRLAEEWFLTTRARGEQFIPVRYITLKMTPFPTPPQPGKFRWPFTSISSSFRRIS